LASRNGGALLEATKTATDAALLSLSRAMGMDVYRNGSGTIGSVAAQVAGTEFAVGTGESVNFEVGQKIQVLRGSSLYNNGQQLEVKKVDRDTDKVTTDAAVMNTAGTPVAGFDAGDVLIGAGDHDAKITGLDEWLPSATALAAQPTLYGCDRSADPTRLAGQRIAFNGSAHETLIDASVRLYREGGRPDCVFVNPVDWGELAKSQEGNFTSAAPLNTRRHSPKDVSSSFGFNSISLNSQAGNLRIIADHNCPVGLAYMLQMDTWEFRSIGAAPRQLGFDGVGSGLRQTDHDGVEYRWGYYGNILCKAPGFNARVALTA